MKTDIFAYEEYRRFLRDRFEELQAADPSFSQRELCRRAGFANTGFFNEVLKGRRGLSPEARLKMARGLALKARESEYLAHMVEYNDARDEEDRRLAYDHMARARSRRSFQRLEDSQIRYYQDPHYPLVRAAIAVSDFRGDFAALGRLLQPPLPEAAVIRCVRDLCAWGLVRQDTHGRYHATHAFIEPPKGRLDILKRINREWILQAAYIQEHYPAKDRHISTALLTVNETTYREILAYMKSVREHILEMVKKDQNHGRVLQLNLQILPRTQKRKESW